MDAEKTKEIVEQTIKSRLSFYAKLYAGADRNYDNLNKSDRRRDTLRQQLMVFGKCITVLEDIYPRIEKVLAEAEAAEQESIKGLPWCGADTRSIVGCICGSHMFCKYRCGELESGKAHCAYPDDDPADSEPEMMNKDKYYCSLPISHNRCKFSCREEPATEREGHWQERAEHFAGTLGDSLHKEIHQRLGEMESGCEDLQTSYFNHLNRHRDTENRLVKLQKQVSTVAIGLDMTRDHAKETDTAFSDTLKGYLERLERVEHWRERHIEGHRAREEDNASD